MQSKSSKIAAHLASGDTKRALAMASRFFDRSDETQLYKQAQAAANNPGFYRQIGKDPEAIVAEAIAHLQARFLPA